MPDHAVEGQLHDDGVEDQQEDEQSEQFGEYGTGQSALLPSWVVSAQWNGRVLSTPKKRVLLARSPAARWHKP